MAHFPQDYRVPSMQFQFSSSIFSLKPFFFYPIFFRFCSFSTIVSIHFQRSFATTSNIYCTSVKGKSEPVTLGAPRGEQYTTY